MESNDRRVSVVEFSVPPELLTNKTWRLWKCAVRTDNTEYCEPQNANETYLPAMYKHSPATH
jgi:hypothetical protein